MRLLLKVLFESIRFTIKCAFVVLPSFLVFCVLTQPDILINRGKPVIQAAEYAQVHEIMPDTRWSQLKPCGEFINEQKEFAKARQCVNEKVWPDSPISAEVNIPRCFVVTVSSPNVFRLPQTPFNFIPIRTPDGTGLVVGVYQPETRTIFLVENEDAAQTYRHELQHLFLHIHDPITQGGGHFQKIWHECEGPYYVPSVKTKLIDAIRDADK